MVNNNVYDIKTIISKLSLALREPLPGFDAQLKMAPLKRSRPQPGQSPRKAAVLIPLHNTENGLEALFTLRPETLQHHGGEISFPGGAREPYDTDLAQTALRETQEEVGIPQHNLKILGQLTPLYIQPSDNLVHPFVGWTAQLPSLHLNPEEVAEVLSIPIAVLLNPTTIQRRPWIFNNKKLAVPCYQYNGFCIWGATAMILSEFLTIVYSIIDKTHTYE